MRLVDIRDNHPLVAPGLGIVVLCALVQLPILDRGIVPMDEGHLAAAVSWIRSGELLYRDIHTGIFPGIYLVTQALFAIFGEDLLVTRFAAAVVNTGTALCLWRITARCVPGAWALLAPGLYIAFLPIGFPVLTMFNYSTLAVGFGMAALLFQLRYIEGGRTADACLLGLTIAGAALTKQNFGALIFIASLLGLILSRGGSALASRSYFGMLWPIAVAGLVPTACVVAGFFALGNLGDLIEHTILGLGGSQLQNFNNPIPPLFGAHPQGDGRFVFLYTPPPLFDYLLRGKSVLGIPPTALVRSAAIRISYGAPLLAMVFAMALLVRDHHAGSDAARRATRSTIVFALVFFPGIWPSAIWSHLAFVMIPMLAVYAILCERLHRIICAGSDSRSPRLPGSRVVPAVAVLTLALVSAVAIQAGTDVRQRNSIPLGLDRGSLYVSERDEALVGGAVAFLEQCAAPGEDVFVAPDIPVVYFLADRGTPQPHDLTIPGNVDGPMIARRLDEAGTRCAVFNPRMYPEFPAFAEVFPQLATYLQRRFVRVATFESGGTEWYGLIRTAGPKP